jgi:hypothetical protein
MTMTTKRIVVLVKKKVQMQKVYHKTKQVRESHWTVMMSILSTKTRRKVQGVSFTTLH